MEHFSKLAKVYLLGNTKPCFGFGDLDLIIKVTEELSLKYVLNQWMNVT